jgi:hypothetical protein
LFIFYHFRRDFFGTRRRFDYLITVKNIISTPTAEGTYPFPSQLIPYVEPTPKQTNPIKASKHRVYSPIASQTAQSEDTPIVMQPASTTMKAAPKVASKANTAQSGMEQTLFSNPYSAIQQKTSWSCQS